MGDFQDFKFKLFGRKQTWIQTNNTAKRHNVIIVSMQRIFTERSKLNITKETDSTHFKAVFLYFFDETYVR